MILTKKYQIYILYHLTKYFYPRQKNYTLSRIFVVISYILNVYYNFLINEKNLGKTNENS